MKTGTKKISRGLKNNNPCNIRINNIRYTGEIQPSTDKAFKQFRSIEYGYRAVFMVLYTYQIKRGLNTIREMISRWAPPEDNNDTNSYINVVCKQSGIDVDVKITSTYSGTMIPIVRAMSYVENGVAANYADVLSGWNLFIKDIRK